MDHFEFGMIKHDCNAYCKLCGAFCGLVWTSPCCFCCCFSLKPMAEYARSVEHYRVVHKNMGQIYETEFIFPNEKTKQGYTHFKSFH